jgi:pyruvate kinase
MVDNPRPTRAEVTDVANAILDGSDAVMLSEETAVGAYPAGAVAMMARIAEDAELRFPFVAWPTLIASGAMTGPQEAVAFAACQMAEKVGAAAIVTCTQSGSTTRLVAKYRPPQPILAMTPDETTYRRLCLEWGAIPVRMAPAETQEAMEGQALALVRELGYAAGGEPVIITAGVPLHVPGTTNLIKVATA